MNKSYVLETINGDIRDVKIHIELKLPHDPNDPSAMYCTDPFKMTLRQLMKLAERQSKEAEETPDYMSPLVTELKWM